MKLLVDMNFSPAWAARLEELGLDAVHWTQVGASDAADEVIVAWARKTARAVVTRDLDPAGIVATSGEGGPSVIQVRYANAMLESLPSQVASAVRCHDVDLTRGAIVVLDARTGRTRLRRL